MSGSELEKRPAPPAGATVPPAPKQVVVPQQAPVPQQGAFSFLAQAQITTTSGPLPSPEILAAYAQVLPDLPERLRVCKGKCEGLGYYASNNQAEWPPEARPFGEPSKLGCPDNGYRFVTCRLCRGTGEASWWCILSRYPRWLWQNWWT